ncbi:MAG: AbrB/MazE/SpoVT family DNA-binding domain-containing protein [Candidatus Wolfebacteria bacterium]|nr:AbrB/MazE/SpoVT family DNA-binding domain-containing protein [Candidatus Wolfebacteria bacterium]
MFAKISKKPYIGITTLGEKGQVVIPADIRKALKLKKGEKLLVFTKGEDTLGITKVSNVEHFAKYLARHLNTLKNIINDNKNGK